MSTAAAPQLGPYQLVRRLGQGAMGAVFLGVHKILGVTHAIKILPRELAKDPQFVERFLREARHAAQLRHPHIVSVVNAEESHGTYYLAMEFIDGPTLADVIREKRLSAREAITYGWQVADALAYAHKQQVIHRDIKPANIMIDSSGAARLTDFGLVRDLASENTMAVTAAQGAIGTPYYMPPEQWHNDAVDGRADLYALGVTLYFALSGEHPYAGSSPAAILSRMLQDLRMPLIQLRPDLNPRLVAVIEKAMTLDRDARYQTGSELAAALAEVYALLAGDDPDVMLEPVALSGAKSASQRPPSTSLALDGKSGRLSATGPGSLGLARSRLLDLPADPDVAEAFLRVAGPQPAATPPVDLTVPPGPLTPSGTQTAAATARRPLLALLAIGAIALLGIGVVGAMLLSRPAAGELRLTWTEDLPGLAADGTQWVAHGHIELPGLVSTDDVRITAEPGGTIVGPAQGSFTAMFDLQPGSHELRVTATANDGMVSELTRRVTVALAPPRLSIKTPDAGSTIELGDRAAVTVAGQVEPAGVGVTINGVPATVEGNGSFVESIALPGPGQHTIRLQAKDPLSRSAESVLQITAVEQRLAPLGTNAQGYEHVRRVRDGMTCIRVPAGVYTMGSADVVDAKQREVELASFLIDRYEVSNEQYAGFLNDQQAKPAEVFGRWLIASAAGDEPGVRFEREQWSATEGLEKRPVVHVTWTGAREYARWAHPDGDLPTEAQWEAAARGTDQRIYPWGEGNAQGRANFARSGIDELIDADKNADLSASAVGAAHMAGNAEEWCLDWYDAAAYANLPAREPRQTARPLGETDPRRVVRGGSFLSPLLPSGDRDAPGSLRTFDRAARDPNTAAADRGFRVAITTK